MPNTYHQRSKSVSERFWEKVDKSGDCWSWTAFRRNGYGYFGVGSRTDGTRTLVLAHRFAYEELVGPVPHGKQLDHLCRNRFCVNPEHLEPVTHQTNMRRGYWATKTHCPKGHEYRPETTSTYIRAEGHRQRVCNLCRNEKHRLKYQTDPVFRAKMQARSRAHYLRTR